MLNVLAIVPASVISAGEPPANTGILGTLGIDPVLIIAQMISFGIVFYILSRFLFPNVRKALNDRSEAISKIYSDQAAIETRLKAFEQEQSVAQKKASEDIQRMMAEAKDAAAATKTELVAKAKEAADAEVASAQKRIELEKANAEVEVAKHAKTLAQSIVQQILSEKAGDAQWQQEQVQAGLDALKQSKL
jgi:F-type H+-transporting ATPase subunit b